MVHWSLIVLKDKLTVLGLVLGIGPQVHGPGFDLGISILFSFTTYQTTSRVHRRFQNKTGDSCDVRD